MDTTAQHIRLPRLNDYIKHWAAKSPDKPAMIQHEDGKTVTYKKFLSLIDFFALRLLDMGIKKGIASPPCSCSSRNT